MRISAAPPQRIFDLMRYLRQMGYAPEEVGFGVVQVEDGTIEDTLTLSRRLLVWSQVNNGEARIIGRNEERSSLHFASPEEYAVTAHLRDPLREDDPPRTASGERARDFERPPGRPRAPSSIVATVLVGQKRWFRLAAA
jgi:hypothetical protein